MSTIVKEQLARLNTCQLIRPLAAATGALLAWKYLPRMTEELWYHALLFLDRHRTKKKASNDIGELYQFVDPTGILEKHKQMLFQPFTENKVDMKIIYYELIKMLIDYERRNNPTAYDATKSVAKIEGYQELTNKLQRFLNQRFILDIQKLSKTQEEVPSKMSERFEKLEEEMKSMRKAQVSLEETNKTLTNEINKVKEREVKITKKLEHFESIKLSLNESNRKLVERVEIIELDGGKLDGKIIQMKNQQDIDMENISELTSKNACNVKNILKGNQKMNAKLEAQEKASKQIWKSIEHTLTEHKTTISEIKEISTTHETKNVEFEKRVCELSKDAEKNAKTLEMNEQYLNIMNRNVSEHGSMFQKIDFDNMALKMKQLEDAFHKNDVKIQEIDIVRRKVNCIEESRQQSVTKIKDEVDETKRMNLHKLEQIRKDIDKTVEKLHKELQSHTSLNKERVKSLRTEVTQFVQLSEENVRTAQGHVENLRQLNRNIIDQLKEKTATEQKMLKNKYEADVQESLSSLRVSLSQEMSVLNEKTSRSDLAVEDLQNKMDILTRQVGTMVGNEEKIKDIVNTIESNQRLEQKGNKTMFSMMKSENDRLETKISEMKTTQEAFCTQIVDIKDCCDGQHSQCVQSRTEQAKMIANTNEKLSAIIDTATKLMLGCAAQEEKLTGLEQNGKDFVKKLSDLESAELFLQESHKMVVGRTDVAEQNIKLIKQDLTKMVEKQKTEILSVVKKESRIITDRVDLIDLSFNTKKKQSDDKTKETEIILESLKDDISKVLNDLRLSENNTSIKVKSITEDIERYNTRLNQLEPSLESVKKKVVSLEKSLKNDIDGLNNQSVETRKVIETCNDDFKMVEMKIYEIKEEVLSKIKSVAEDIGQENDKIDKTAKENASKMDKLKTENNIEKQVFIQRIEDLKICLNKIETEFQTMQTSQILGSNKSDTLEEKLGNLANDCSTLEKRITSLDTQCAHQCKMIQTSETSSREKFELVANEIKVDIRNSKEELRKQRCVLVSHNSCMSKTRHQLDAVLLHLKLTA